MDLYDNYLPWYSKKVIQSKINIIEDFIKNKKINELK